MVSESEDSELSRISEAAQAKAPKNAYMAIYVLLAAAFIAILNETVMSVAIPVVKADLNISAATAGWLTTSFLLTMAVVIPVTGFLISAVPFRILFAVSQGLFVVGTVIGAFAPNFGIVLLARIVQASGTAVLLPLLMTTVLNVVPEHERGRMMGRMSVVIAVAPAIGPTISGLILEIANNNWHALFDTMLPLGLIVLVAGVILVPNIEEAHRYSLGVPQRRRIRSAGVCAQPCGCRIFAYRRNPLRSRNRATGALHRASASLGTAKPSSAGPSDLPHQEFHTVHNHPDFRLYADVRCDHHSAALPQPARC